MCFDNNLIPHLTRTWLIPLLRSKLVQLPPPTVIATWIFRIHSGSCRQHCSAQQYWNYWYIGPMPLTNRLMLAGWISDSNQLDFHLHLCIFIVTRIRSRKTFKNSSNLWSERIELLTLPALRLRLFKWFNLFVHAYLLLHLHNFFHLHSHIYPPQITCCFVDRLKISPLLNVICLEHPFPLSLILDCQFPVSSSGHSSIWK